MLVAQVNHNLIRAIGAMVTIEALRFTASPYDPRRLKMALYVNRIDVFS